MYLYIMTDYSNIRDIPIHCGNEIGGIYNTNIGFFNTNTVWSADKKIQSTENPDDLDAYKRCTLQISNYNQNGINIPKLLTDFSTDKTEINRLRNTVIPPLEKEVLGLVKELKDKYKIYTDAQGNIEKYKEEFVNIINRFTDIEKLNTILISDIKTTVQASIQSLNDKNKGTIVTQLYTKYNTELNPTALNESINKDIVMTYLFVNILYMMLNVINIYKVDTAENNTIFTTINTLKNYKQSPIFADSERSLFNTKLLTETILNTKDISSLIDSAAIILTELQGFNTNYNAATAQLASCSGYDPYNDFKVDYTKCYNDTNINIAKTKHDAIKTIKTRDCWNSLNIGTILYNGTKYPNTSAGQKYNNGKTYFDKPAKELFDFYYTGLSGYPYMNDNGTITGYGGPGLGHIHDWVNNSAMSCDATPDIIGKCSNLTNTYNRLKNGTQNQNCAATNITQYESTKTSNLNNFTTSMSRFKELVYSIVLRNISSLTNKYSAYTPLPEDIQNINYDIIETNVRLPLIDIYTINNLILTLFTEYTSLKSVSNSYNAQLAVVCSKHGIAMTSKYITEYTKYQDKAYTTADAKTFAYTLNINMQNILTLTESINPYTTPDGTTYLAYKKVVDTINSLPAIIDDYTVKYSEYYPKSENLKIKITDLNNKINRYNTNIMNVVNSFNNCAYLKSCQSNSTDPKLNEYSYLISPTQPIDIPNMHSPLFSNAINFNNIKGLQNEIAYTSADFSYNYVTLSIFDTSRDIDVESFTNSNKSNRFSIIDAMTNFIEPMCTTLPWDDPNASTNIKNKSIDLKNIAFYSKFITDVKRTSDLSQNLINLQNNLEIQMNYILKYKAQTDLFKYIIFTCCVALLGSLAYHSSLLSSSMYTVYLIIVFSIGFLFIIYKYFDIFIRSKNNFNEIDYNSFYKPTNKIEQNAKSSYANDLNADLTLCTPK